MLHCYQLFTIMIKYSSPVLSRSVCDFSVTHKQAWRELCKIFQIWSDWPYTKSYCWRIGVTHQAWNNAASVVPCRGRQRLNIWTLRTNQIVRPLFIALVFLVVALPPLKRCIAGHTDQYTPITIKCINMRVKNATIRHITIVLMLHLIIRWMVQSSLRDSKIAVAQRNPKTRVHKVADQQNYILKLTLLAPHQTSNLPNNLHSSALSPLGDLANANTGATGNFLSIKNI